MQQVMKKIQNIMKKIKQQINKSKDNTQLRKIRNTTNTKKMPIL